MFVNYVSVLLHFNLKKNIYFKCYISCSLCTTLKQISSLECGVNAHFTTCILPPMWQQCALLLAQYKRGVQQKIIHFVVSSAGSFRNDFFDTFVVQCVSLFEEIRRWVVISRHSSDSRFQKLDPRTSSWPLMSSPLPTLAVCLVYIFLVKVGKRSFREIIINQIF